MADKRKSLPHLFKKGQSGNPKGKPKGSCNKFCLSQFHTALMKVEKNKRKDLYVHVAEMAFKNPFVLIHVLKKLLPDMRAIDLEGNLNMGALSPEEAAQIQEVFRERFKKILKFHEHQP